MMREIDFINNCVLYAEGFDTIKNCLEIKNIYSIDFGQIEAGNCISFTKMVYPLLLQRAIEGINKDKEKWRIIQVDTHIRLYDSESELNIPELICKFSEISEIEAKEAVLKYIYEQKNT